jgi:hypothetical protein
MNRLMSFALVLGLGLMSGCGTKAVDGGKPTVDVAQLTSIVTGLGDAARDPAKFSKLWVTPPDAATAAKYTGYLYYAGGAPSVSGTTAKIKMKLEKPAGTVAGEPEWEFEKAGDTWKIKSAPLT